MLRTKNNSRLVWKTNDSKWRLNAMASWKKHPGTRLMQILFVTFSTISAIIPLYHHSITSRINCNLFSGPMISNDSCNLPKVFMRLIGGSLLHSKA